MNIVSQTIWFKQEHPKIMMPHLYIYLGNGHIELHLPHPRQTETSTLTLIQFHKMSHRCAGHMLLDYYPCEYDKERRVHLL